MSTLSHPTTLETQEPGGAVTSKDTPASKTSSVTKMKPKSVSPQKASNPRMSRLFSHVPPTRTLRTVLAEMERELRQNFPNASKRLTSQGQDAQIITDIRDQDEAHHAVEDYNEVIVKAKEAIAMNAQEKIQNGDTVMIYGYSEVIKDTLLAAIENGKKFSLIIVENSLGYRSGSDHGRDMTQNGQEIHALHIMKYLTPKIKDGSVSVTHIHLSGLSFVIRTVTKLLLTAYALLTNGGILGRIGTAQIALMAHKKNIPVVVCCETFKFCDESPVDSFFQNQRGHLKTRTKKEPFSKNSSGIAKITENPYLKAPVLKYDITPAQFVTAVITEVDIFPATSIPLLLSVQENRNKKNRGKHAAETSEETEAGQNQDPEDIKDTLNL